MKKIKHTILLLLLLPIYGEGDHPHRGPGSHGHDHASHIKGVIRGVILDQLTELPKEFASISIIKEDMRNQEGLLSANEEVEQKDIITGGITDSDGNFYIDEVPIGKYELLVQYIGYNNLSINDIVIRPPNSLMVDLGLIKIEPKMLLLDDVSIVESPIIEEVAKTIYPVADTARESGGSADEVLEQLPGLSVDMDGNITLRGDPNVTILIDGRKSKV